MRSTEHPLSFNRDQRERLTKRGLNAAQIRELERTVLMFGRAWLSASPAVTEVRKPIEELRSRVTAAEKILSLMLRAASGGNSPRATANAGNYLLLAASQRGAYPEKLEALAPTLLEVAAWCDEAIAQLPSQSRSNAGHWMPVARIWEALVRSCGDKPMTVRLSASPGSAFREVCGICYEVMTSEAGADPERAVKAYVAASRRRDEAQRAESDIAFSPRIGRQPGKKG